MELLEWLGDNIEHGHHWTDLFLILILGPASSQLPHKPMHLQSGLYGGLFGLTRDLNPPGAVHGY